MRPTPDLKHIVLSCCVVVFAVFGARAGAQAANTHPDRRYVVGETAVSHRISIESRVNPAAARNVLGAVVADIGTEGGPDETIFGRIGAVAMTQDGIVVVDLSTHDLRVFDTKGQFRQRVGRRGAGPGEFRAPQSIRIASNQELWVFDTQRRVTIFTTAADGYRLSRTIPVDGGPRSVCAMGSELFLNSPKPTDPVGVRVMDSTANILRSFANVYSSPNALVNYSFTDGRVACDTGGGVVVYATSADVGEIRGYSSDGRPMWRTALDGLKHMVTTDIPNGSKISGGPEGAHALLSLHVVPSLGVIAQYAYRTFDDLKNQSPPSKTITLRIDPRTGAGEVLTMAWPHLAAIRGDRAIAVLDDPFPRLQVRALKVPTTNSSR